MKRSIGWLCVCFVCSGTFGCGSGTDAGEKPSAGEVEVGKVSFALTLVPNGVSCVQVNVDMNDYPWAHLATQNFGVSSGSPWSGTVPLGSFQGNVWVTASAYNVACASIGTAMATWTSDALVLDITAGDPTTRVLNFKPSPGVVVSGNFAPAIASISVGEGATGLRLADGSVKILGLGVSNPTLTNVAELAVGNDHACVRKTDGTVWCWGENAYGQLGNGTTIASPGTPVQVTAVTGATTIAAGFRTSCANVNTTAYCWGSNLYGALGNGTTVGGLSPVVVTGLGGADKLATSEDHSCGAALNGTTYCWGRNANGGLGNGGTVPSSVPVSTGLRGVLSLAVGGNHSCAVSSAGQLYCWGDNGNGQVGNNTTNNALTPVQISGFGTTVAEVTTGWFNTCARTTDGAVYCWGSNYLGEVGDGTGAQKTSPVQILSNAIQVRSGGQSACALSVDRNLMCWGSNLFFQLGDGTRATRYKPVPAIL